MTVPGCDDNKPKTEENSEGTETAVFDGRYDMADVFTVYDEDRNDYSINCKDFRQIRITSVDSSIFKLLGRCPLLPTSTICKAVDGTKPRSSFGKPAKKDKDDNAYKRVKVLFDNGYLARFDAADRETGFVKSAFYLSDKAYEMFPKYREKGMMEEEIGSLSVITKLEMSQLSRWCAFALLNQPGHDVAFRRYLTRADAKEQYTELILEKKENISLFGFRKGYRCIFHVISAPKDDDQDRLMQFVMQLQHYEEVCSDEESGVSEVYSYVIIVCENIPSMEHLAAGVEKIIYSGTSDAKLHDNRYLYSLEIDGDVQVGAFKFLHKISFPKGSIIHDQVGFK